MADLAEFKMWISVMVDELVRSAVAKGAPTEPIFLAISAESLELAARIHINRGGCDSSFLGMARDVLAVVRVGAPLQ